MQKELFHSAKLKIQRCNNLIDELRKMLEEFATLDCWRLTAVKDDDQSSYIEVELVQPVPENFANIAGDALHNLRAALDHTMSELVTIAGYIPTQQTAFVFEESEVKLKKRIQKDVMQHIGYDIIDHIVNIVQPIYGSNAMLDALRDFDNDDKHTKLIPVLSLLELSNVNADFGNNNTLRNMTITVEQGHIMRPLGFKGEFKLLSAQPVVRALFGKNQPYGGTDMIVRIRKISYYVEGVLSDIEKIYNARTKKA